MDLQAKPLKAADAVDLKACCAAVYQSDWARLLLGDSFHPGGLDLTGRLGSLLSLGAGAGQRVLDVASGQGTSAIFLAQRFGCEVLGVEYSDELVRQSTKAAEQAAVADLVRFTQGDAERLPVDDESFDAVICECAFCTFPDKRAAAAEFARVLRPGGRVGLSDLTRSDAVPPELQGLLAWIACIADAQPLDQYARYLECAGLDAEQVEPHNDALSRLVQDVRTSLLGAELLVKLKKMDLPNVDFDQARTLARNAAEAVRAGTFGYAIVTARKPG